MQLPVFIHTNPRDLTDSSIIRLISGIYMVYSDHKDTIINLSIGDQVRQLYENVQNSFRFIIYKEEILRASIVRAGTEPHISVSIRRITE